MVVESGEVAEVVRWAGGIKEMHQCIARPVPATRAVPPGSGISARAIEPGGTQEPVYNLFRISTAGSWIYDWAAVDIRPLTEPGKGHWLLARRSIAKSGELAY